jgi:hypothetical protein
MTRELSFDALPPQLARRLLLINGQPEGWVTLEEFNEVWSSDVAGMVGYENIELASFACACEKSHSDELCAVSSIETTRVDERVGRAVELAASHLKKIADDQERLLALCITMLGRTTDPTHLSIEEVARIERVSLKTVRNRISSGHFDLQAIPGTRRMGIPVEQVFARWMSIALAKDVLRRERTA